MNRKASSWAAAVLLCAVITASCAATQRQWPGGDNGPGFFLGLWHGFVSPITFFVSLFSETVRIYASPNSGRWYDFGFMLGISGFSGGFFARRRRINNSKSQG